MDKCFIDDLQSKKGKSSQNADEQLVPFEPDMAEMNL
jgi:hypothetical protein